jgi:hypothetical protein
MFRVRISAIALGALISGSSAMAQTSQAGAPTESLSEILLKQAQNALDAFDRPNAEKFARQILEQMTTATRPQKQRARVILANVYYPEEAPAERKRSQALVVLKDAVRDNFDFVIDRTQTWAGIDSILTEAKATTFGLAAAPSTTQMEIVGPAGRGEFKVRSSRPAIFSLSVVGANGTKVVTVADSSNAKETTLRFAAMANDRPLFTSGDYEIIVTAKDAVTGDTINSRFPAAVVAPALTFTTVPTTLDSAKFARERTKPFGFRGVIVGGLVGAAIYNLSSLHGDTTFNKPAGVDSKGSGIAVAAAVAVVAASFLDRGRRIPSAVAANQKIRDDFATSIQKATAENANRIATYKTVITVTPGAAR